MGPPIANGFASPTQEVNFRSGSSKIAECMIVPREPNSDWHDCRHYQNSERYQNGTRCSLFSEILNLEDQSYSDDEEKSDIGSLNQAGRGDGKPGGDRRDLPGRQPISLFSSSSE